MVNEMFCAHFPDLGPAETRTITLPDAPEKPGGIPAGEYGFFESYCTDPNCDCRRVLLHVVRKDEGVIAVVSFGFDPDGAMPGPFLDPLHPQPKYAADLLDLVRDLLLSDPAYVARLERHYHMMKQKTAKSAPWWKKPKKAKKPRRWGER
jgi:hypothetical protein